MTALPPDPDPVDTPSEERAGGVPPGEISPQSAQTSASKNPDPTAGRNLNPRAIVGIAAIVVFVALFAAVAIVLIIQI
ncbi:hypothetical protein FK535_07370 [Mycolicibacterium sp. 018/SC-01/001]|uniref:DUF6480 family protein n=1 Tax=Mycolicibacterium sp. 018/SC-01/001 TaxID=2592069 RepID=UPI00117E6923|nr:DUF6480 family protein [Mycolicibacterium sp. 018/SC-01/001]TRW86275.1 hypothetical protein FK535_07370 [Mycolicibacterium sp. 018/SC-01/001]